jgi:hypothetical protein
MIPLLLMAAACSDYKITPDNDGVGDTAGEERPEDQAPPTDSEEPTDTEQYEDTAEPPFDQDEDCPDGTQPGYGATINKDCVNEVETGTFTPVEEWSVGSFATANSYNNVMMQPIVASLTDDDGDGDIDEDDVPDIIVTSYAGSSWTSAGVVRAFHGDGSGEIWSQSSSGIQGSGSLAAGDIDNDGVVEIIGVTPSPHQVVALDHDGTEKWRSATITQASTCYAAAPALADLEGDGDVEIVVGNVVLEHDGSVRFTGAGDSNGWCASFPVDLFGDGEMEIVAGDVLYSADGATLWNSTASDGYPAVADFDLDGVPEIVISNSTGVSLLNALTGNVLWSASSAGQGPPTVADYDGDGYPEVGVAGTSTYTVLDTDGSRLWQNATTDASSGRTGSSVFDFEGDGVAEVIYADEYTVWVFSGVDGSVKLQETDHTSWTWIEYAVVADVDGDNQAEIVAPHGSIGGSTAGAVYGLTVIGDADGSWQPGRKIWNQHAYSITNVDDDGGIPRSPDLNWLSFNNFRSGDLTAGGGVDAPDALAEGEVCEVDCDEGLLVVWVHPGNIGADDSVAGGTLGLYVETGAGRTLAASETLGALAVGEFQEAVRFEVVGWDPAEVVALEVEVSTVEPECDPTNNTLRIEGPFCE